MALLTDVAVGEHADFVRVRLTFEDEIPAWHVASAAEAFRCGSGDRVELDAPALVEVRLSPAAAHREDGSATIDERSRRLSAGPVRALELTCDFEAEVVWVIGVAARRPFRVIEFADPPRLAVDVAR